MFSFQRSYQRDFFREVKAALGLNINLPLHSLNSESQFLPVSNGANNAYLTVLFWEIVYIKCLVCDRSLINVVLYLLTSREIDIWSLEE